MGAGEADPTRGSLDAAAAALRADVAHLDLLLHSLVDKLRAVPGLDPVITYRRSRLRKIVGDVPYVNDLYRRSSPIESIRVNVGNSVFGLTATESSIACSIADHGAGAGRSPVVSFSDWIRQLMAAVDERNRITEESLNALRDLIIFDRVS